MGMTSDEKTILDETGFSIGKLYFRDCNHEIDLSKAEQCCFDEKTKNFHLYPDEPILMQCISHKYDIVRKLICKELEQIYGAVSGKGSKGNIVNPNMKGKYADANGLYRYICIVKEGVTYCLNFMRFFTDDESVNCILESYQFDYIINGDINKNDKEEFEMNYATSAKSEILTKQLIKERVESKRSFCYNPNVDFTEKDYSIISEKFRKFIDYCEEIRKK